MMAVVNVSSDAALASRSASTTVMATVSPERYAKVLLRYSSPETPETVGAGVGVGMDVAEGVVFCVGATDGTGVGDGACVGVGDGIAAGVGVAGADSVVNFHV